MIAFTHRNLVGAYVCPRGVYTIECSRVGSSVKVQRRFEVPVQIDDAGAAADQVIRALRSAEIMHADVAVVMRGFGISHHVLQLPPARDELLAPIVDREFRRMEPHLTDPLVGWVPLPPIEIESPDAPAHRSLLAAGAPRDAAATLEQRLSAAGHRLLHLTALPAAMQRLIEEFETPDQASAFVAPLPDGAFIGFSLNGALRLVVEPPLPPDVEHEAAALAEEVELGVMFVRQQFRGAHIDQVSLVGSKMSLADADEALAGRLHVPTQHVGSKDLSPAALAALGAVLDAQSPRPLALAGLTRRKREQRALSRLETASLAAVGVVGTLALWVLVQTVRAWIAGSSLQNATRRVEQDAFGLEALRSTVSQRRMVRQAVQAMRVVAIDRADLQQTLGGIAAAVRPPVLIDSLELRRSDGGWTGVVGGNVTGPTNARAVEALHDAYRLLPQRLSIDSLHLERLTYSDDTDRPGSPLVRFQMSFGVATGNRR